MPLSFTVNWLQSDVICAQCKAWISGIFGRVQTMSICIDLIYIYIGTPYVYWGCYHQIWLWSLRPRRFAGCVLPNAGFWGVLHIRRPAQDAMWRPANLASHNSVTFYDLSCFRLLQFPRFDANDDTFSKKDAFRTGSRADRYVAGSSAG